MKFANSGGGGKSEKAVISLDVLITVDFITHETEIIYKQNQIAIMAYVLVHGH